VLVIERWPQPALDRPGVVAPVGESVAAGVTRHVLPSKPLIRDHEAACAAYESTRKATANMLPSNPRYRAAEAAERRTDDREMKTLLALLGCQPTTLVGVLAALEHVSKPEWLTKVTSGGTGETILSGIHECTPEDIRSVVRPFPLRLVATLRGIFGMRRLPP
jgi:hypothetical protein